MRGEAKPPTFELVKDFLDREYRGKITVKGKGESGGFARGFHFTFMIQITDILIGRVSLPPELPVCGR